MPLGWFGRFVVERAGEHRRALDVKSRGVFPVTQAVRVYALSIGAPDTNTLDRLAAAGAHGIFTPAEVAEISDAYDVVTRLRLARHLACLDGGREPDDFVEPGALGKADRVLLKEAFRSIAWVQRHLDDRFSASQVT